MMNKYISKMTTKANKEDKTILDTKWNGAVSKYRIKCNKCGFVDSVGYVSFLRRELMECNICNPSKSVKWSIDSCVAYVNFLNVGVKLISERYGRSTDEYLFKCSCGKTFRRTWFTFYTKQAYYCRLCSTNSISWDHDKCVSFAKSKGVRLISTRYNGYGEVHSFKCSCGEVFNNTWRDYYNKKNHKCMMCSNNKVDWDAHKVRNLIVSNSNSELVSECYHNNMTKLKILCGGCGQVFERTLCGVLKCDSYICTKCSVGRVQWDICRVKQFVDVETENTLVSTEYTNAHDKLRFKCSCGANFDKSWRDFKDLHQRLCNYCANTISKGERIILDFLKKNDIPHIREYRDDQCRYEKPLPFDFYIPTNDLLIEFDGVQHFEPTNFAGCSDEEALITHKNTVRNDNIKNKFAEKNGFKLVRIPYWDIHNIDDILENLFGI